MIVRVVRISVSSQSPLDLSDLPTLIKHLAFSEQNLWEEWETSWRLEEEDWNYLKTLRGFVSMIKGVRWREEWRLVRDEDDVVPGSIFCFSAPHLQGAKVVSGYPVKQVECDKCQQLKFVMVDDPAPVVELPANCSQPVISFGPEVFRVASVDFYTRIVSHGLGRGLKTFPVSVRGCKQDYVGLFSDIHLGSPVTPYGSTSPACDACGSQKPRYCFLWLFDKKIDDADWFWQSLMGPTDTLVTPQVYEWLRAEFDIEADPYGWYPADAEFAFLPEEFQGVDS
jgi:hypothetical protein